MHLKAGCAVHTVCNCCKCRQQLRLYLVGNISIIYTELDAQHHICSSFVFKIGIDSAVMQRFAKDR